MNNDFGLSLKAAFKREELKEFTKTVTEEFENFLKKYNVNTADEKNPTIILYKENLKIKDRLYDKSYKTVRDLTKAEGKLELIRKYIEIMEKENIEK
ncbi:hypothetical protein I6E17_09700 [Fusobacterium perfoetens]|uniref:hypothetical protein n=1 Tax=Fusobacterium perfoetens TaxID=852 RepID=UPI001F3F7942|nr:hypothetical protein [Fusobacterium perfoetens]MCF2626429.1 hypothetical protein [Fusobacterium perfoetens]